MAPNRWGFVARGTAAVHRGYTTPWDVIARLREQNYNVSAVAAELPNRRPPTGRTESGNRFSLSSPTTHGETTL